MKNKTLMQSVDSSGRPIELSVEFKQRVEDKRLDLFIESNIVGDSEDFFTGETIESETSAAHFKRVLEENADVTEIRLFVNSNGGSVFEAMGIRAHLLAHRARKIAFVTGRAASAASFILTGCNEVYMISGSTQMLHNMWVIAAGNAKELREIADQLDKLMEANREMYLEAAGDRLTEAKLIELMDNETWLTARECEDLGLCDKVLTTEEYSQMTQGSFPPKRDDDKQSTEETDDDSELEQNKSADEPISLFAAIAKAAERI